MRNAAQKEADAEGARERRLRNSLDPEYRAAQSERVMVIIWYNYIVLYKLISNYYDDNWINNIIIYNYYKSGWGIFDFDLFLIKSGLI